jgi:hypothetical protein
VIIAAAKFRLPRSARRAERRENRGDFAVLLLGQVVGWIGGIEQIAALGARTG